MLHGQVKLDLRVGESDQMYPMCLVRLYGIGRVGRDWEDIF